MVLFVTTALKPTPFDASGEGTWVKAVYGAVNPGLVRAQNQPTCAPLLEPKSSLGL